MVFWLIEPIPPINSLKDEIRDAMEKLGVSQKEIGDLLGLTQSAVSKIIKGTRDMRYSEAEQIISYLLRRISILPYEAKVRDIAVKEDELEWAFMDDKLVDIAERMFKKGFSQMPVKDRESMKCCGVLTDLSILRLMLSSSNLSSLRELAESNLSELGAIDDFSSLPPDEHLIEAARILLNKPAVLVEFRGEVTGIVTRADFIKLLNDHPPF